MTLKRDDPSLPFATDMPLGFDTQLVRVRANGANQPLSEPIVLATTYSAPSTILSSLHSIIITARSVSDPEAIAQVEVKISCAKPKDCIP